MKYIGLGPFLLGLPECNEKVVHFPPTEEDWDLIVETINLVKRYQKRQAIWTDGTWIP